MKTSGRPQPPALGEQGSALLIVFLFAAMVAIYLYTELPIVAMEAQRQKEQTLIDRATEYQRAIQVYYRNRHTYPPTIDALENTNNLRFLRRRYKDPMTGKDDWRILHMGPGGVVDSLVNPLTPAGGTGQSGFGQNPTGQDGFGQQSGFGQGTTTNANSAQAQGTDPNAVDPTQSGPNGENGLAQANRRRRPPAAASSANGPQDPNAAIPVNPGEPNVADQTGTGVPGEPNSTGQQQVDLNGQVNPNGSQNAPGALNSNATLANQIMRNPGTSPAAPTNTMQQPTTTSGNPNPITGGAIAGVASKVHGKAIKIFDNQRDYAKWEFVYDFRKDTGTVSGTNPQGAGGAVPLNQNGLAGGNTNSSFGQNSTSFGTSTNQNVANPNAPPANSNPNAQNPNQN